MIYRTMLHYDKGYIKNRETKPALIMINTGRRPIVGWQPSAFDANKTLHGAPPMSGMGRERPNRSGVKVEGGGHCRVVE